MSCLIHWKTNQTRKSSREPSAYIVSLVEGPKMSRDGWEQRRPTTREQRWLNKASTPGGDWAWSSSNPSNVPNSALWSDHTAPGFPSCWTKLKDIWTLEHKGQEKGN
jgi:hypothetical protein